MGLTCLGTNRPPPEHPSSPLVTAARQTVLLSSRVDGPPGHLCRAFSAGPWHRRSASGAGWIGQVVNDGDGDAMNLPEKSRAKTCEQDLRRPRPQRRESISLDCLNL